MGCAASATANVRKNSSPATTSRKSPSDTIISCPRRPHNSSPKNVSSKPSNGKKNSLPESNSNGKVKKKPQNYGKRGVSDILDGTQNSFDAQKSLHGTYSEESDLRSVSRANSSGVLTNVDNDPPKLALFCNKPGECFYCQSLAVTHRCDQCEDFHVCDECMVAGKCDHDPTHPLSAIYDMQSFLTRTCCSSFAGDDVASSSLFYDPCDVCCRVINDTELVYHCEECNAVICNECYQSSGTPTHDHPLKPFRRSVRSGATESTVVTKTRNSEGNKIINDYVVVKPLGRGAFSKVNLVQHYRYHTLYALKILRHKSANESKRFASQKSYSNDDLLREISVMKFVSHPNIVKLKEVINDVESHKVYVIMEYCEKGPVYVHGNPPLPLEKVRKYSRGIMSGLLHLHGEFLFHRDIKPANCLVDENDVVKIADFGTCTSEMRNFSAHGTPAYSCPEQYTRSRLAGNVVDSWAFAVTVFQMAFGFLPVCIDSLQVLRENLLNDKPIEIPAGSDPELRDALSRMLNKDLSKRMLLWKAAEHPFFRTDSLIVQSSIPMAFQCEGEIPPSSDLYEQGVQTVVLGRDVGKCFHGVRAMRKVRGKFAAYETSSHDNNNSTSTSTKNNCNNNDGIMSTNNNNIDNRKENGDSDVTPVNKELDVCYLNANQTEVLHLVSMLIETQKRGTLKLVGMPLCELPPFCTDAGKDTTTFLLSNNGLSSVSKVDFSQFSILRQISITNNSLTEFPIEILAATRLQEIDLSNNCITNIPVQITKSVMLRSLSLHNNCIKHVGTDASGRSLFSGRSLRKVRLSGNPLSHLPDALETCPSLELILDDVPDVVKEWSQIVHDVHSVVVVWNDIYPRQVHPNIPIFVSVKDIHFFSLTIIKNLGIRHIILPPFVDQLPSGEIMPDDMDRVGRGLNADTEDALGRAGRAMQIPLLNTGEEGGGWRQLRPAIVRRAVCRYVHSYFVVAASQHDEEGGYKPLQKYIEKRIKKNERIFICLDEKKISRQERETVIAILCQTIKERNREIEVGDCYQMVVDAMKGLYG